MGMPTVRWPVLAGLAGLAIAGLALAACGTQQAATTSSAAQPASSSPASPARASGALCRDTAAVTRVVVTRVDALPQNHLHFAAPAGVTITDPGVARGLAQTICGLPTWSHNRMMSCPIDLGVSYRLSFAAGRAAFPVVTVTAGGCGGVSGAGPERRATSVTFWIDLARDMGIAHPTAAALQGTS